MRVIFYVVRVGNFINCGGRVYERTNDLKGMTWKKNPMKYGHKMCHL